MTVALGQNMQVDPNDARAAAVGWQIAQCVVEWAWLIDHGAAEDCARLFTQDAVQEIAGVRSEGLAAIAAGLKRRQAMTERTSRHVASNLRLTSLSADEASATWMLTLYRSDTADRAPLPFMVADVVDRYRLSDGEWRVCARTVSPVFTR